jgi:hypothetical protein
MGTRNVGNLNNLGFAVAERILIQTRDIGLEIYGDDLVNPVYSFNAQTKALTVDGDLTVTGSASFETINISEYESGLLALAIPANPLDPAGNQNIGFFGLYDSRGVPANRYTGIINQGTSPGVFVFFQNMITRPVPDSALDLGGETEFASAQVESILVNSGVEVGPSLSFFGDSKTGFWQPTIYELAASVNENNMLVFRNHDGLNDITVTNGAAFKLGLLDVTNSTTSNNPAVTTGSVSLQSESAKDKWIRLYSASSAGTPAYAGVVFASPTNNYFFVNTGTNLELVKNTSAVNPPDYRDSTSQVLVIGTEFNVKLPIRASFGTLSAPGYAFDQEATTGFYRPATDTIAIVSNSANLLTLSPTELTSYKVMRQVNGSVSSPAYSFTNSTSTGIYYDSGATYVNTTFTVSGTKSLVHWLNTAHAQTLSGTRGTISIPSFGWVDDASSGFYSATNGQVGLTLTGQEAIRFRRRTGTGSGNTEIFNSVAVSPLTVQKVQISDAESRFAHTFKAYDGSFQSYNLIEANPVVLYTFRLTGTTGKDYSGNGNNATAVNSPTVTPYVTDGSKVKKDVLDLTGNTSKYLLLSPTPFASLDNTSISFWFKISGALATNNTIFYCHAGAKQISIRILSDADTYANALEVTVDSDALTTLQYHTATPADVGSSPVTIKDGLWHHVVIHLGSGIGSPNIKHIMFLDNVELSQASNQIYYTSNGDNNASPEQSTNSFDDLVFTQVSLGAKYDGSTASLFYTGYIKDFLVTGKIVSVSEVAQLSTEPYIYGYALDVAVLNAAQINSQGSLSFVDGTASGPSITFTSDSDTGLYYASNNTLGISAGGNQVMTIGTNTTVYGSIFEQNISSRWFRMCTNSGQFGPRVVFCTSAGLYQHSIRTQNSATLSNNSFDFYMYDTGALDGDGLGNNLVMRLSLTAASANSTLATIYGIQQVQDGSVSAPAYAFTNSPGTGLYRIGANNMGFAANGVRRMNIDTNVTIGSGSGDTTYLYTPLGTNTAPAISFIGDTNTGIYSSAADNLDFTCGGANLLNLSSAGLVSQVQQVIDLTSTTAFTVRKNTAAGDVFTVDTTNEYIGLGYTSLTLSKLDTFNNSTNQRLLVNAQSALSGELGIRITNTNFSSTNALAATYGIGVNSSTSNFGTLGFYYVGSSNSANEMRLAINGGITNLFTIRANDTVNVNGTLNINATTNSNTIIATAGTAANPTYSFSGNVDGLYQPTTNQLGLSTNGVLRQLITNTYNEWYQSCRFASGSASAPAITFTSDTSNNTGIYLAAENSLGITNNGAQSWVFNASSFHQSLNGVEFLPNGTNVRLRVQNDRLRATSNQTILPITPILHYKFTRNISNTDQDESINKISIQSSTASYITSTISLTDSTGVGLLQYNGVQLVANTDRIESTTVAQFIYLSYFAVMVKFKLTSTTTGNICEIYGNNSTASTNYIRVAVSSGNITLSVVTSATTIAATSTTTISSNIWYSLVLTFNGPGHNISLNGSALTLSYTTGSASTTFAPANFTDTSNVVAYLGGKTSSALGYFAEFYIAPIVTTETVSSVYGQQVHELYTNKLQLGSTGLVDEGYLIRSDKGNNLVWDNSLQIFPGYIQFNSSKVLRVPDGSVTTPSVAFINSTNTGLYLIGSNNIGIATNSTKRIDISDNTTNITNDFQLSTGFRRSVTTVSGTSVTLSSSHNIVILSYTADATNVTVTLPSVASHTGREYILIKTGNGGGNVTINTASGSEYIDDNSTTSLVLLAQFERATLICDGVRWYSV